MCVLTLDRTFSTTAEKTARCIRQHFGPAFANDLLKDLANLLASTNEFTTAYSSEENGNKEILRHFRALVFEYKLSINTGKVGNRKTC